MEIFMTKIKLGCFALMLVIAAPLSPAWAGRGHGHGHGHHHGHHHHRHGGGGGWGYGVGIGLGLGLLGYGLSSYARSPSYPPAYSYPPAGYASGYGYAPVVSVPAAPPVYIQQGVVQAPPQAQASNYWHYCRNPEGYYPYVKNCPGGWLQVVPQSVQ
ncbi:MAG: hypothetical protein ABS69_16520 [Nitrosomonadales bacterium SCN 54-20]|nr:MAG: hypothetical protein ABS69_16520 [Nitrosomonadales bacterium SCN 54-20]